MDIQKILALYDQEQRRDIEYPHSQREAVPYAVRQIAPKGRRSFILYTQLEGIDVTAFIEEQVRYFESIERDFEWKVYSHDSPPDLKDRLQACGFEIEEVEPILVSDLSTASETLVLPFTHDIRRITDPAKIDDVIAVENMVWETDMTWLHEWLGYPLREYPDYLSLYIAYVEDRPASCAWITFHKGHFAGLWGGSTLAEYRGQGLYTALLAARVQEAQSRGVRYLTIDASPMSRPIVEKFGFQVITVATPCVWYSDRKE